MPNENPVADIGLIGLAVMGENLALNIADHGYAVAVYNRTTEVMKKFVAREKNARLVPCETIPQLIASIKRPRKFIILVKAGAAVDAVVQQLIDNGIAADDIVGRLRKQPLDGHDPPREAVCAEVPFFGSGVSGGEVGARFGPSMMPGGHPNSWQQSQADLGGGFGEGG